MISAEDLVFSYKKEESKRITGSKDVSICYWSDNSSGDEYKLESNVAKYIKKKPHKEKNVGERKRSSSKKRS